MPAKTVKTFPLSFVPMPVTATKPGREIAVGQLHATVTPEANGYAIPADLDRAKIVGLIRELAPLSRSQRWADGVENWAALVEDEDNPLTWAYLQGSTSFVYATLGLL